MAPDRVLGLDLGGTDLKAALVARDGRVLEFARRPSRTAESAGAPFEALAEAAALLRAASPGEIAGAGLGCPGVIHPGSGEQVGSTANLPHWEAMPVAARAAERLGMQVEVDNDANCAALAEAQIGAARGATVSITVTLGTGIGCGVVTGGRVLRGAFGGAGEIGHLPLGSGSHPCRCGVERCVEPEASASGLLRIARAAGLEVADAAAVFARAGSGDETARALIDAMADRLGAVLAVAINLLNPAVVVVGGGVSQAGEPLFSRLRAAVSRYALESHRRGLAIVPATLGERAGCVGAGLMAWDALDARSPLASRTSDRGSSP